MGVRKVGNGYEVRAYDPAIKRLRYAGRRTLERDAKKLFREKTEEWSARKSGSLSVDDYAQEWLEHHHGPGTKRPEPTTKLVNEGNLRAFLAEFGERKIDGGIGRKEALRWSKSRPHVAKSVSAMFNDAIDDEECTANPFANRRHERSGERRRIHPITQAELDLLCEIADRHWGGEYGRVCRAWVLFAAWVGCRPGETFSVPLANVNLNAGEVTVRRVKKRDGIYPVDTVVLPRVAGDALREVWDRLYPDGPMFRSVTGKPMDKGNVGYHWRPIRDRFAEKVGAERYAELCEGSKREFDLYSLRHRVASVMADRGATSREISEQLGNSPEVCEACYIHPFRTEVRERNRRILDGASVTDLAAVRDRKMESN